VADTSPVKKGRRPGRPRLTEPSAEYLQRLDEIIQTAAEVFQRDGYDAGSLDDVAAELDLRKASLYYYVKSKAHLLYLIFDRAISLALQRLEELAATKQDPRERLAALITHQVTLMTESPSLFTVFFDSRPRLESPYDEEIRDKERQYLRWYADAVVVAVEAGVIPKIDARYGAQALLGMTSWTYKWFDPSHDDVSTFAGDLVSLVLGDGIAHRPSSG
jgi:AcrR family transcriptional regulator